jgi:hypothetical protein
MRSIMALTASLFLIITGINAQLTRTEAAKLIKEKYGYPYDEYKAFTMEIYTSYSASIRYTYEKLAAEGLLTWKWIKDGAKNGIEATLTEKGLEYYANDMYSEKYKGSERTMDMRTSRLEFVEITGILMGINNTYATVEFTVIRKDITPFGRIVFFLEEGLIKYSAQFNKYDDGWRIK